jgi:hypothetical protein
MQTKFSLQEMGEKNIKNMLERIYVVDILVVPMKILQLKDVLVEVNSF